MDVVFVADVEYLDDIRVVESGDRARFVMESLDEGGIVRQVLGEHLHSYRTPERELMGFVDDPHSALAELFEDPVISDLFADHRLCRRRAGLIRTPLPVAGLL